MQLKTLQVFYFATIRSLWPIRSWRACLEHSRSMGLTETPWPPPLLSLKCFWLLLRKCLRLESLIPPRRSFWIMRGAAIKLLMRMLTLRCRPWRRTTSCCLFHTGSDTEFPTKRIPFWEEEHHGVHSLNFYGLFFFFFPLSLFPYLNSRSTHIWSENPTLCQLMMVIIQLKCVDWKNWIWTNIVQFWKFKRKKFFCIWRVACLYFVYMLNFLYICKVWKSHSLNVKDFVLFEYLSWGSHKVPLLFSILTLVITFGQYESIWVKINV